MFQDWRRDVGILLHISYCCLNHSQFQPITFHFHPKGGGGGYVLFINHISNTSSAFALIYLKTVVLTCLRLAFCLLLTTKILTTWITRHLSSRPKMSTHHVLQHARSHVASTLKSHLTSKPFTGITRYGSPSTQVQRLA